MFVSAGLGVPVDWEGCNLYLFQLPTTRMHTCAMRSNNGAGLRPWEKDAAYTLSSPHSGSIQNLFSKSSTPREGKGIKYQAVTTHTLTLPSSSRHILLHQKMDVDDDDESTMMFDIRIAPPHPRFTGNPPYSALYTKIGASWRVYGVDNGTSSDKLRCRRTQTRRETLISIIDVMRTRFLRHIMAGTISIREYGSISP